MVPLVAAALVGCSALQSAPETSQASATTPYVHVATLKQLMEWVLDPSADVIWDSVKTIMTEEGTKEIAPKTDDEWAAIRNSAAMLAESSNLLMMEGRAFDR